MSQTAINFYTMVSSWDLNKVFNCGIIITRNGTLNRT